MHRRTPPQKESDGVANEYTAHGEDVVNFGRISPEVRLVSAGAVGRFNRAQRGIDNTREKFPAVVAMVLMSGFVCPAVVAIAVCCYAVGRIFFTVGSPGLRAQDRSWGRIGVGKRSGGEESETQGRFCVSVQR